MDYLSENLARDLDGLASSVDDTLVFDAAVARGTAHLYERVKDVIPAAEWPRHAP